MSVLDIDYVIALARRFDALLCKCGCSLKRHYIATGLGCEEHGPHTFTVYRPVR